MIELWQFYIYKQNVNECGSCVSDTWQRKIKLSLCLWSRDLIYQHLILEYNRVETLLLMHPLVFNQRNCRVCLFIIRLNPDLSVLPNPLRCCPQVQGDLPPMDLHHTRSPLSALITGQPRSGTGDRFTRWKQLFTYSFISFHLPFQSFQQQRLYKINCSRESREVFVSRFM